MKVLLLCRSLPCHVSGGLEYHTLDLAKGLLRIGVSVDLLTTTVPPDYRDALLKSGLGLHELDGVRSDRYSLAYLRRIGPMIDGLMRSDDDVPAYDVVHGQEFALGFWRPSSSLSSRIVISVHGTITSETPLHPDVFSALSPLGKVKAIARFGRRKLFEPSWKRHLDAAGLILVDSKFTERELNSIRPSLKDKVRLVQLGVDMDRYPEVDSHEARRELGWEDPEGPILITVGRVEWQKGHDLALRALAELRDLPWRYFIVGEGGASDRLRGSIRKLGLGERVEMTGRVEDGRKSLMLAGADLFLWPERTHPAFGLVGLEAFLMNTPVVGSRRGAIPEVIDEQSGWLFAGDDAPALASILRPLLADPALIAAKGDGLRRRTLERFDPESMARGVLAAYEELVG